MSLEGSYFHWVMHSPSTAMYCLQSILQTDFVMSVTHDERYYAAPWKCDLAQA